MELVKHAAMLAAGETADQACQHDQERPDGPSDGEILPSGNRW